MPVRLSTCGLPRCWLPRCGLITAVPTRNRYSWAHMGKLQERLRLALAEGNIVSIHNAWVKSKWMTWEGRSHLVENFRKELAVQGVPRKKIESIAEILLKDDAGVAHYIPAGLIASLLHFTIEERLFDWSHSIWQHLSNDFYLNHWRIVKNYRLAPIYLQYAIARSDDELVNKVLKSTASMGGGSMARARLSAYLRLGQWANARTELSNTRKAVGWTAADFAELVVNALRLQHEIRSGLDSEEQRYQYGANLATIEDILGGFFGVPHLPWKLQDAEVTDKEYIEMLSTFTDSVLRSPSSIESEATMPNIGLLSAPAFRTILRAVVDTKGSHAALALIKRCCYAYDPAETATFRLLEEDDGDIQEGLLPSPENTWSLDDRAQMKSNNSRASGFVSQASPVPLGSGLIPDPRSRLIYSDLRDYRMLYRGALREMRWIKSGDTLEADQKSSSLFYNSHPALLSDSFLIKTAIPNFERPSPMPSAREICDTLGWLEENVAHRRSVNEDGLPNPKQNAQFGHIADSNSEWRTDFLQKRTNDERKLLSGTLPLDSVKEMLKSRFRMEAVDEYLDNILDASNIRDPLQHQTTVSEEVGTATRTVNDVTLKENRIVAKEPNMSYVAHDLDGAQGKPTQIADSTAQKQDDQGVPVILSSLPDRTTKSRAQRMSLDLLATQLEGGLKKRQASSAEPIDSSTNALTDKAYDKSNVTENSISETPSIARPHSVTTVARPATTSQSLEEMRPSKATTANRESRPSVKRQQTANNSKKPTIIVPKAEDDWTAEKLANM